MSILSEITKLQNNLTDSYTACQNKGATLPANQNFDNLADTIDSITTGSGGDGSSTGQYLIQVIDYDGTVLKSEHLDEGDIFILPSNPSHTGLTFQSWSSPVTITNGTIEVHNSDVIIGATYTTESGLNEFDITLTTVTGLSVTLKMDGSKNWGDGTTDTATTHTYASEGNYTITCDGTTMTASSSSGLFGQSSSNTAKYICTAVRLTNITSISSYAFVNCYSLTSITIPNGVASIGSYAFGNCYSLISITIPNGVDSIGESTFNNCYSLTSITIPSSVTRFASYTFSNCYSLASITIPSSVTTIGSSTFYGCYSLVSITIPNNVAIIGTSAFYNCHSLTSITIPNGVTAINARTFDSCYSLTSITIPSSVTEICDSAFNNCYSLTSITIPNGVTTIKSNAFFNCYSLTSITIPSSVTKIGSSAFNYCNSIIEYDFGNNTSVPTLSSTATFTNINGICKIKVPFDLYDAWSTATNWIDYIDYIDGGRPATLNFDTTPSGVDIYVKGSQINGLSTSYFGSVAPYVCYNSANNVVLSGTQTGITEGTSVSITANLTNYNKITLSTGVMGLDVTFKINGVTFNATDEGNGDYSINVVGSGVMVGYNVTDSSSAYLIVNGTITTTSDNITENITMQAVTWQTFTRPNLSDNGTLGGSSFAVNASSLYSTASSYQTYRAVDGSTSQSYYWSSASTDSTPNYTFYNPNVLKVSQINLTYYSSNRATTVTIQGSNDNTNWTDITSSYSGTTSGVLTVTGDIGYKYHKLKFGKYSTYIRLVEMTITAQEGVVTT